MDRAHKIFLNSLFSVPQACRATQSTVCHRNCQHQHLAFNAPPHPPPGKKKEEAKKEKKPLLETKFAEHNTSVFSLQDDCARESGPYLFSAVQQRLGILSAFDDVNFRLVRLSVAHRQPDHQLLDLTRRFIQDGIFQRSSILCHVKCLDRCNLRTFS